jgi:hypothetical protein
MVDGLGYVSELRLFVVARRLEGIIIISIYLLATKTCRTIGPKRTAAMTPSSPRGEFLSRRCQCCPSS